MIDNVKHDLMGFLEFRNEKIFGQNPVYHLFRMDAAGWLAFFSQYQMSVFYRHVVNQHTERPIRNPFLSRLVRFRMGKMALRGGIRFVSTTAIIALAWLVLSTRVERIEIDKWAINYMPH